MCPDGSYSFRIAIVCCLALICGIFNYKKYNIQIIAMKIKTEPSIESENFFLDVSKLPVVPPVFPPVVISVVIPVVISVVVLVAFSVVISVVFSLVISETYISVVSLGVVLLNVVSDIGTVTSFVYNQIQKMHTKQQQKTNKAINLK